MICLLLRMAVIFIPVSARGATTSGKERAGDLLQLAIPALAYTTTFYVNDAEGQLQLTKSLLATMSSVYGLKYVVKTKRPNGCDQSFPSGHTAAAVSGAAFIQRRYGWSYGLPLYLAAGFVGWSRVSTDHHYPSDVYAGAALALAANWYFVDPRPAATPLVSFWSDRHAVGLALNGHW